MVKRKPIDIKIGGRSMKRILGERSIIKEVKTSPAEVRTKVNEYANVLGGKVTAQKVGRAEIRLVLLTEKVERAELHTLYSMIQYFVYGTTQKPGEVKIEISDWNTFGIPNIDNDTYFMTGYVNGMETIEHDPYGRLEFQVSLSVRPFIEKSTAETVNSQTHNIMTSVDGGNGVRIRPKEYTENGRVKGVYGGTMETPVYFEANVGRLGQGENINYNDRIEETIYYSGGETKTNWLEINIPGVDTMRWDNVSSIDRLVVDSGRHEVYLMGGNTVLYKYHDIKGKFPQFPGIWDNDKRVLRYEVKAYSGALLPGNINRIYYIPKYRL